MRFFLTSSTEGMFNVPGPVSFPLLSMSDIVLGTVDDARLSANVTLLTATQTLTNKTIDTATNDITVSQSDVTGLTASLALKLDAASYTAADVLTKLLTVDGAGSGLDADLLDGLSSASFLSAATYTAADVLAKLLTVDGSGSGLDADLLDGNSSAAFQLASGYTAADVLTKLLTVDGAGSGLDADLLDGSSSAAFLQTATYQALVPTWTGQNTWSLQLFGPAGSASAPTYAASADPNTGLALPGSDVAYIATAGSERVRVDANGRLLFNTATVAIGTAGTAGVQFAGTAAAPAAAMSLARYSADATEPRLTLGKSRGATIGAFDAVTTSDFLGSLNFAGADGTNFSSTGAQILAQVDAAVSTGIVPGRLVLRTTNTAGTATEALRLNSGQQMLLTDGTAALPSSAYISDADSGPYRIGANNVGVSMGGAKVLDIATTGLGVTGNLTLSTAGNKMLIKEGTNASMGVATMVAGTVVVNTTLVTANSRIFLSVQSLGTVAVATPVAVTARTAGTSFTISSSALTDTSVVAWHIVEPA